MRCIRNSIKGVLFFTIFFFYRYMWHLSYNFKGLSSSQKAENHHTFFYFLEVWWRKDFQWTTSFGLFLTQSCSMDSEDLECSIEIIWAFIYGVFILLELYSLVTIYDFSIQWKHSFFIVFHDRKSFGFGTTWVWIIDDIFFFSFLNKQTHQISFIKEII